MHKLSGILIAALAIAALAMLFAMTGCQQKITSSTQITGTSTGTPPPTITGTSTTPPPPPAPPKPPKPRRPEKPIKPVAKPGPYTAPTDAEVTAAKKSGTRTAIIKTEAGEIVAELYGADTPLTVANFIKLAKAHFYDGLSFHRVETDPSFSLIQGGDPQGSGGGGPGYSIKLEVSPKHIHIPGALAMARTNDPDSAGSQFYITTVATPNLDGQYSVFGKVIKNLDVAEIIGKGDKIISITIK